MRIGVHLGPFYVSGSTRRRGRRAPARRSGYQAAGTLTLADGSIAHFRCEHSHTSRSRAIECTATCQRQIRRGPGPAPDHLGPGERDGSAGTAGARS